MNNDFYIQNNALKSDDKKKGNKIIPIVILILLLGVIVFLVYELKFNKKDSDKSDEYVEYDPNYKLEDEGNRKELDSNDSNGLIDVEETTNTDSNSDVTSSNKAPDNILSNILSNVNKTSNNSSSSNINKNIRVTGVSINNQNITMYVGQTSSVSATVTPENATNKSVKWTSSDTNVVIVDNNGRLDAKKVGTANITVTTNDGFKTSTVKVTVVTKPVPVTGVKLNASSITLSKNEKTILKTTITPSNATNNQVTWKSSNESVVTVDQNGTVTAKNYGTANITVTTNDGKKTATVKVNVPQPDVSSISVYIAKYSSSKLYVGANTRIYVEYYPTDAANKSVTWKSSNTKVATVDSSGTIKAVGRGTATITATTPNGKSAYKTFTVVENPAHYSIKFTKANYGNSPSYALTVYKNGSTFEDYSRVLYKNSNGITVNVYKGAPTSTKTINENTKTATLVLSDGTEISGISVTYVN